MAIVIPFIEKQGLLVNTEAHDLIKRGMNGLKQRAKTMVELAENSLFYIERPPLDEASQKILDSDGLQLLKLLYESLISFPETSWTEEQLENYLRNMS